MSINALWYLFIFAFGMVCGFVVVQGLRGH